MSVSRFCQKMVNDLGHKIRRSKERLKLTQLEQLAAAGISQVQYFPLGHNIGRSKERLEQLGAAGISHFRGKFHTRFFTTK